MSVTSEIVYEGNLRCRATHGPSGGSIVTDAPTDNHGKGEAFSPTDLVGAALATCIVTIMGIFAQRHDLNLEGTTVKVVKEMTSDPRRIGQLTVDISFPVGLTLTDNDRTKLERAAEQCPVKRSLHPDVNVILNYHYPA